MKSAWHRRIEENYNVRTAGRLANMTLARGGEVTMAEYIDRQLCEIVAEYDKDYRLVVPLSKIRRFPTSDVAPVVHGQWKFDTRGLYPKPLCSRCSEEPWRKSNHQSDLPKYCPNCGARMDLEENNG